MNQINDLNDQLAAARAALTAALVEGNDTTELRYSIGHIENELNAFIRIEREEQDRIAAEQAAELAGLAHGEIDTAATFAGLEELNGEPLPAIDRSPEINHASRMIAVAQAKLAAAEARHKEQFAKVTKLAGRHSEKVTAIDAIKQRRIAGDEHAGDAAELALLATDAESLAGLVATARAEVIDDRAMAREELAQAQQYLEQLKRQQTLAACKARAELAERLLLATASAAKTAAKSVGGVLHPSITWAPSPDLRKLVVGVPYVN